MAGDARRWADALSLCLQSGAFFVYAAHLVGDGDLPRRQLLDQPFHEFFDEPQKQRVECVQKQQPCNFNYFHTRTPRFAQGTALLAKSALLYRYYSTEFPVVNGGLTEFF